MTSKNSFLVSSIENQKRRIWVWIITLLVQLALYPGIMIIYLSRIESQRETYRLEEGFRKALQDAATDAVGFNPTALVAIIALAVIIGVQGFSYLYDRKKVDMYHSVPVSMKKRFLIIYGNGILIYILPTLLSIVLAIMIAATQGAFTVNALAACALGFIGNLLFFLVIYHTAILAVMLTGHVLITGCAVAVFLFIGIVVKLIGNTLLYFFFTHASAFFEGGIFGNINAGKFSIILDYIVQFNQFRRMAGIGKLTASVAPVYAKWFVLALICFALAYFCYRKRPAESAGCAIAFRQIKPFIKIVISTLVGLAAYFVIEDVTYHNQTIAVLSMLGAAVLCCVFMEAIYEFDIRAAFKHLVSTGMTAVVVIIIFCIFRFDVFGYDDYIPDADKIESVAISLGSYQQYFEWDEAYESLVYASDADYYEENMFLTDTEAICELVRKGYEQEKEWDDSGQNGAPDTADVRYFSILYRLKSGRNVYRSVKIDLADASNEALLNKLIGSAEYKEGYYQIMKNTIPFDDLQKQMHIYYMSGAAQGRVSTSCAEALRQAWIKDMEQFDYTMARNNRACGYLQWELGKTYTRWELPVYENFTNTIALLKEQGAYYPLELCAEDIESLEITNYHYDEQEEYEAQMAMEDGPTAEEILARGRGDYAETYMGVTAEYFDDPEEIAAILEAIYPQELEMYWNETNSLDRNYDVVISFKSDSENAYGRGYYNYEFLSGQVPDFVVERTAYTPGAE